MANTAGYTTWMEPNGVLQVSDCIYWSPDETYEIWYADSLEYTCSGDSGWQLTTWGGNTVGPGMAYTDSQLNSSNFPAPLSTSPCIEAGSPTQWASPDFFGTPRPQDFDGDHVARSDIGCYEAPGVLLPVYRFYRPALGTHFYTANESEKDSVRATLAHIYTYEGPAYNVSADDGGGAKPTVWRFYNVRNGTHFYTADPAERDHVSATWPSIYQYEGTAFWVGQ